MIAAAAAVFAEKGYEAATLWDIGERLGTDRASLYYYADGKQGLLREAVKWGSQANLKAAERILRQKVPGRDKIRLFIEMMMTSYEQRFPHLYVYLQEELHRVAREDSDWAREMMRQLRRIETIATKIVEQAIREGSVRDDVPVQLTVLSLFGMLNWTYRWFKPGRPYHAQEVADAFTTLFLDGARPPQPLGQQG